MIILKEYDVVTNIQTFDKVFEPSEALAYGTIFPSLVSKYKYTNPVNKNYGTKKDNILGLITEYDFALLDLGLYLDTHKDCKKAMELFNNYNQELKKLKLYYEKNYDLLCKDSVFNDQIPFKWINSKWPWEN